MRCDTSVFFQTRTKGEYNANTGDYGAATVTEVEKLASVTDSGILTMNAVYGNIKQGSKVIRLNGQYNAPFDYIRIGGTVYRVDKSRPLRHKHIFVVSEVKR